MVIKELKARGLVKRILVVCPTGLVTQWAAEMQDKFHEKLLSSLPLSNTLSASLQVTGTLYLPSMAV